MDSGVFSKLEAIIIIMLINYLFNFAVGVNFIIVSAIKSTHMKKAIRSYRKLIFKNIYDYFN